MICVIKEKSALPSNAVALSSGEKLIKKKETRREREREEEEANKGGGAIGLVYIDGAQGRCSGNRNLHRDRVLVVCWSHEGCSVLLSQSLAIFCMPKVIGHRRSAHSAQWGGSFVCTTVYSIVVDIVSMMSPKGEIYIDAILGLRQIFNKNFGRE